MFRIARNLVIDYHRTRVRTDDPVPLTDLLARNASQDVALAVNQALGALPDVERDVFLMREVSGLSYDEIASVCDLTPEAVRSRLYRTRLELRERLEAPIATHRIGRMRLSDR
jgi:RNA polymerase sigma-70 factor (ECF subfamily)